MVKQSAFVFIKPHAVTEAVKTLVSTDLKAKGFTIESEGRISAEQIDQGKLVRLTSVTPICQSTATVETGSRAI